MSGINEDVGSALGCFAWEWAWANGFFVLEDGGENPYGINVSKCNDTISDFLERARNGDKEVDLIEIRDETFKMLYTIIVGTIEGITNELAEKLSNRILGEWAGDGLVQIEQLVSRRAEMN